MKDGTKERINRQKRKRESKREKKNQERFVWDKTILTGKLSKIQSWSVKTRK